MEDIISVLRHGHSVVSCFTVGVLALVGMWEIYSNFNEEKEDNLSIIMYKWSERYYYLLFFWGTVGGHLFFGTSNIVIPDYVSILIVVVATTVIMIFDVRIKRDNIKAAKKATALLLGFLTGHYLWTMNAVIDL